MKNRSKISRLLSFGLLLGLLQGCSNVKKDRTYPEGGGAVPTRPTEEPNPSAQARPPTPLPEVMGPPELYGPPVPSPTPQAANFGPEPVQKRPVVLVLGPGLARGYTYVGVLRAFKEHKIPVAAILGTEMGGLIAALYGMSANINEFEWRLLKLVGDDNFLPSQGFFLRKGTEVSNGEKFEKTLGQLFGSKDLSQSKIPIRIAIQAKATGIPIILDHGNVVRAVRAALAAPSLFSPGTWSTQTGDIAAVSAGTTRPYLVNEARGLGLGPVIVVDVLSKEEAASAQSELSSADLVIQPDVRGIDYLEFQKKTEAAFRGKNSVLHHLSAIKKLLGWSE